MTPHWGFWHWEIGLQILAVWASQLGFWWIFPLASVVVVANPWQFSGDGFFGGGFGKTMVGRILRTKLLSSLQLYTLRHNNGNPPFPIGNTSSNGGFSIAMLDYRRVCSLFWNIQYFRCVLEPQWDFIIHDAFTLEWDMPASWQINNWCMPVNC